ncbi:MAG: hypothetical protein ABSF98_11300 [Bryobacteraceae bacterium]
MRSRINSWLVPFLFLAACARAGFLPVSFTIDGDEPGPWPQILSSVGFSGGRGLPAGIFVVRAGGTPAPELLDRVRAGGFAILEGESGMAAKLGFVATKKHVVVRSIVDRRAPKLSIVWEKELDLPVFAVPKDAQVFAEERWQHAPLMAGMKVGGGAVLWVASSPGQQGYERYPYLLQALCDLGLQPPVRSSRLWAFFDSAYRSRADPDYLAARWRKAGIGALQVAGWHTFEREPQADEYLRNLIAACHRHAILVYVWLELPHVSEKFWNAHPEWREKTALLQDAQLDWRKLMNLRNPAAFEAVRDGVRDLIGAFDWDGVNVAELYFESLEGAANPARFTPMNDDIRREFREAGGFDPLELFAAAPPNEARLRAFLDYRAGLARRMQQQWIEELESIRRSRPNLDLVLTHVDDRFDTRMRDLIGADAARALPLAEQHDVTFLIEDPATIWNLGPQRYPQIAERYRPIAKRPDKLAIDINIVERYQDVYPTKQQTGVELFQLVHLAAMSFPRVALYFENSILPPDLALLSAAAAAPDMIARSEGKLVVESKQALGVAWDGPALVNGKPWPVRDDATLWLPPGAHAIEPAAHDATWRVLDFNGTLRSATRTRSGVELAYESAARAIAVLNFAPAHVEVDGVPVTPEVTGAGNRFELILPRGQHLVVLNGT